MGIKRCGEKWAVSARVRDGQGRIIQRRGTVDTKEQAKALIAELKKAIRQGRTDRPSSLTALKTFGDVIRFYNARKGYAGMKELYGILSRDLGAVPIESTEDAFDRYLNILRTEKFVVARVKDESGNLVPKYSDHPRSETTVNRYIQCARIAFGFAVKHSKITGVEANPIKAFDLAPEAGRDRVWTEDEKLRIFNTLQKRNSPLYWAVYFSQWNPIRRGDIFRLTRENLDRFKPWVHFYPQKTRKKKPRETVLQELDKALLGYFDSLPGDCPLLFPRLQDGKWSPMGTFRRHWVTVLDKAKVEDFNWHDLKHCAVTWMLDNGYDVLELKSLGIQYDQKLIDRYYHHDANKVLEKRKAFKMQAVNPQCEPFVNHAQAVAV